MTMNTIVLSLLVISIPYNEATSGYLFYEDASCSGSSTITGAVSLAWDDSSIDGFSMDYSGPCMYFSSGSYTLSDQVYYSVLDELEYGYCVQCDGMVGCSSDGTCDRFMSTVPQNSYQGAHGQEVNEAIMRQGYHVSQATSQQFQEAQSASIGSYHYVLYGGLFGLVSILGLLAVLEGARQLREKKVSRPFSMSLSETLSYEYDDGKV